MEKEKEIITETDGDTTVERTTELAQPHEPVVEEKVVERQVETEKTTESSSEDD